MLKIPLKNEQGFKTSSNEGKLREIVASKTKRMIRGSFLKERK
jgi:hypothetical protein